MQKTVLVTGSQGFIGSYVCAELLNYGYKVIGIDNYSKYGPVDRPHDKHKNFKLIVKDIIKDNWQDEIPKINFVIAGAAMIGGISYFHKYAYDLLANNERIIANTFDFCIDRYKKQQLDRIIVLSSSMVFENSTKYPTPESEVLVSPPPASTYGFQKLACEFFCKGAFEQYKLPYTIVRPFNCIGVGENEALGAETVSTGNVKMMMSHVVPDLIYRAIMLGPDKPLPILGQGNQIRNYTNGKDIAYAIRICLEHENAINNDFNISSPSSHSVKELAEVIYQKLYNKNVPLFEHMTPFEYDVQCRIPDISKAKNLLDVTCDITLEDSLVEVIDWIKKTYF